MMIEITLSPAPRGECCAQSGQEGYEDAAGREIHALIAQLHRQFGEPPMGSEFGIGATEHETGWGDDLRCDPCYELWFLFDDGDEEQLAYARKVQSDFPKTWDGRARIELGLQDDDSNDS